MSESTIKKGSPQEKLLARLKKKGGVEANRKALKSMQDFFSKELSEIDVRKAKEKAWK
jgi:hypothetical protein